MLASWFVEQCVLVCAYMRAYAMCIIINFKCPNLTARCSLTLTPPKNEQQYALCKHHTYETDRIRTKWKKYQSTLWLRLHIISSARWVFKTDAFFFNLCAKLRNQMLKIIDLFFLLLVSFFHSRIARSLVFLHSIDEMNFIEHFEHMEHSLWGRKRPFV